MDSLTLTYPVKPFRGFRLIDLVGRGAFGAPRDGGKRRHLGVDLTAVPEDDLVAPISGRVELVGWAYPDADLGSLTIRGDGVSVKILYIRSPLHVGELVKAGDPIGQAQDVVAYYARKGKPGMTNHIHLELALTVDPLKYLPSVEVEEPLTA